MKFLRRKFYIATDEEILNGEATDVYFTRVEKILESAGLKDKKVRAEFHTYGLPKDYSWAIFAGLEEALNVLENHKVDVYALPEGILFREREPVMLIEGEYYDFALYESIILGILRHYTSIATKTARIKYAAGNKQVLFFGLRSLHPALAPLADRAALIGGADSVSGVLSKKYLGVEPSGTMPHSLMIIVGDQAKAWKLFDENIDESVPRIILVDTFWDERIETELAMKTLGKKLYGVRLDTPSSRRGNFRKIIEEVRWALDLNGFKNVKIIASGGLNEEDINELKDIVDAFGVGTSIAFPPSVDISMDIVEVYENGEWIPRTKRGKLPGAKKIYRCPGFKDQILPWNKSPEKCEDGSEPKLLLKKYIENGKLIEPLPDLKEIRKLVLSQLNELANITF
ncbi:nicotinate phosphoribosyltransferase [Fervidicoccus fontis]|uniref:nicotinate phosphoribosyltransferase n=1 Tax=Fervidicoccus fontis (strain DSM 19380 / JCM 18336 / VKM B-2539 / Kam940) TaxID=1163730 RepID=I0A2E2_FERFK|nr:nicotinate phosphoribosyltransferase [Fervidicoccus fontis Kam940]